MLSKRPDTPLAESPEATFEYTKKYSERKRVIEKNPAQSGVKVSSSGTATAKPYEKKFIPADSKRTRAIVVDGKGKVVKQADSVVGKRSSNEKLYREYKKDSTDTMDRRNRNANFRNINTGAKKDLSASDKKILANLGKIKTK